MSVDRLFIEKKTVDFYKTSKILHIPDFDNKDQFLVAMSLGYKLGIRTPLKSKEGFVRESYLKEADRALIYALAIKENNDIKTVSDLKNVFTIAEEYANAGINFINKLEKKSSFDEHTKEFEKIVNKNL